MAICWNCGAVVADNSSYCEMCGQAIASDTQSVLSSLPPRPANKEESIKLCTALASKYASYEKLKGEIHDLEFSIKKMEVTPNAPRYSFFRFYWPFFIIALAACFFSTLIVGILTIRADSETGEILAKAAGYLSIPIVLGIGIVVARARQSHANDKLAQNDMLTASKASELRAKVNEMKEQQREISDELQYYKDLIPMNMRNKGSILKIKKILDLGQAETIEQAVEFAQHPFKAS